MNSNIRIISDGDISYPKNKVQRQIQSKSMTNKSKSPKQEQNNDENQGHQGLLLRFATWNTGTLNNKSTQILEVLSTRNINIIFLQDTKMTGKGYIDMGEYTHYYCSIAKTAEDQTKYYGVGVLLHKSLEKEISVMKVDYINDRLIHLQLRIKSSNVILNISSLYAPQPGCKEKTKTEFWYQFDKLMMSIPDEQQIIFGGDFNAHVGTSNEGCETEHGGWGYGSNDTEGEIFLNVASMYNLSIVNTFFKKAPQDLITYSSGKKQKQIDYFLTRNSQINFAKKCEVLPDLNLKLQHKLLLLEIKVNILTEKMKHPK